MQNQCLIYVRVSTAEQAAAGHFSLAAQEELCRRHAESIGFSVAEVFRDEGASGRTSNRPGFRKLMEYTSAPRSASIAAVLVQDTGRLARNSIEYLLFRRELEKRGIALIAVTQPHLDASPEGRLMDTIVAGINEYQSAEKGRRVAIAMKKKFEVGWWPNLAPLGYRNAVRSGEHIIVPDPGRFELVSLAFDEYATGRYSQESLGQLLRQRGLVGKHGSPVPRVTLNSTLANSFYFGLMRWNGLELTGRHRSATTRAIWEQCQAVTSRHNRSTARARKHDFLLAGLTRCAVCLNQHTRSVVRAKNKRYYHCASRSGCRQPYIPADDLENQVRELLKERGVAGAALSLEHERLEIQQHFCQFVIKNRTIVGMVARRGQLV
jgi:site-specific DNA recombinase